MSEQIEGRNAVLEAFRSGKCVDKLFILDGCQDGPSALLPERQEKKIRLLTMWQKNVWISAGSENNMKIPGLNRV